MNAHACWQLFELADRFQAQIYSTGRIDRWRIVVQDEEEFLRHAKLTLLKAHPGEDGVVVMVP